MGKVGVDVLHGLDLVPVNVGIATKDAHLVLTAPLYVGFTDRVIEPFRNGGGRADPAYGVAPGPLNSFERDGLPAHVVVHGLLVERVAELHHSVSGAVG